LAFDGVDDYASVGTGSFPHIERAQTLALWLAPEVAAAGADEGDVQVLFTMRRGDYSGVVLALESAVPVAYNPWGPRDLVRADVPLVLGRWQHLAYVLDAAGSHLYLDGTLLGSGPAPATNRTPITAFIGSLDGYSGSFHGSLDELRLYARALTALEVADLAQGAPLVEEEPLVLYLPFDELAGARSYDRSGLANHAQLGDGVLESMPRRVPSGTPQSSDK
jgi:hypothetical protein